MYFDYHVHTIYSDDSDYPMEDVIKDAIAHGIEEICFTDHVDYGVKWDHDGLSEEEKKHIVLNVDYPAYFEEIEKWKSRYGDRIKIRRGLEFGIQQHTIVQFEKLYETYDMDFILLSCHQIGDLEFWNQAFQKGKTQQEYNEQYYEAILHVMQHFTHYSVLAHLDLIKRYDEQGIFPFEPVRPLVTEILKKAIADGKGIEINTSSFRYGLPDLTPSREILRLYRDLGGTILTIGSDSHMPCHLGAHIPEVIQEVKEMGFPGICTFEHMKPMMHPF